MKTYPADFEVEHNKTSRRPLYVVVQSFDTDESDVMVLTGSPDTEIPPSASRPGEASTPDVLSSLLETTPSAVAYYGRSLAMSKDGLTLAISSPKFLGATHTAVGSVYTYTRLNVGEPFVFQQVLPPPQIGVSATDEFAHAIAISDNGLGIAVGIPGGSAWQRYIYEPSLGWITKTSQAVNFTDALGTSVSMSDAIGPEKAGYLAAGAPNTASTSHVNEGMVYVHNATQFEYLTPAVAVANTFFGTSVKISSDSKVIFVGARTPDNSGAVYMYDRGLSGFNPIVNEVGPFSSPNPGANRYFGVSLDPATTPLDCSYDGTRLFVGERGGVTAAGSVEGVVHVYASGGTELPSILQTVESPIQHSTAAMGFGSSVAVSRDLTVLFIGALEYVNKVTGIVSGGVFIYKLSEGLYVFSKVLQPADAQLSERFGYSVVSHSTGADIAVGAPMRNDTPADSGRVSVFSVPESIVFDSSIANLQGVAQAMDQLSGKSTLGLLSYNIIDYDGDISRHIADKLKQGRGLNNKIARFYRGYPGIPFSSYVPITPQRVETISQSKKGLISVAYIDLLDLERTQVFDLAKTNITAEVLLSDTEIEVLGTVAFGQVEHGPQYKESPSYSVGTVTVTNTFTVVTGNGTSWLSKSLSRDARILVGTEMHTIDRVISDTEIRTVEPYQGVTAAGLAYTAYPYMFYFRLEDELVSSLGRVLKAVKDTSTSYGFVFDGADWYISNVTTSDQYQPGARIIVSGSALNNGKHIVSPKLFSDRVYVEGALVAEAAGASVNLSSPVQFFNCARGAKGTTPAIHSLNIGGLPSRQIEVGEIGYLTMPGPMMALALMTGKLYNQTPVLAERSIPASYHMRINERYVNIASFENVGTDLWDLSDQSGIIFEFVIAEKEEGKRFLEQEIYRVLGDVTFTGDDGRITYKRITSILFDAATVGTLNSSNAKFGDLTHDLPNLSNFYVFDWDMDPITGKRRERDTLIDITSRDIHDDGKILHYTFRGISRDIYTKAFIYSRMDDLRDSFSGPPLLIPVEAAPSQDKYQIGDVVFCESKDTRNYTNPKGYLSNAMMVLSADVDYPTGKLVYKMFGSSRKADLIINQLDDFALDDSVYSVAGGMLAAFKLDALGALNTAVDAQGVLHITGVNGAVQLPGNDNGNLARYWHDTPVQFDSGVVLKADKNWQLWVKGQTFIQSGAGIDGVGLASTNISGFIGSCRAGGGVGWGVPLGHPERVCVLSTQAPITTASITTVPYFNLANSGSALKGLPANLQGVVGSVGLNVVQRNATSRILAVGGSAGAAGSGGVMVTRGLTIADGGYINLSGTKGSPGQTGTVTNTFDDTGQTGSKQALTISAGAGAGGHPGALTVLLDGVGSFAVGVRPGETFIAEQGAAEFLGEQASSVDYCIPSYILNPVPHISSFYVASTYNKTSRAESCLRIQRIQDAA